MDTVYNIVVALHVLGMAAIVGGWLAVVKAPVITPVILWGARAQFVTGLILVGIGEAVVDKEYDHAKIAVKLIVSLAVVTIAEITNGRQKRNEGNPMLVHVVGGLAVLNTLVAVLWT
ncbi:hypothetical protein [Rhodococcus sp. NPDC058521]|uniref:hypothetical protein n=1 Tax=Rhodococcus sp. NPDC058521 TaxID=3346536 RepID=UPI00365D5EC1